MIRAWVSVLTLVLATALPPAAGAQAADDPLAPLLFLEGTWHGQGVGPYGTYEFETVIQRRGRWLLAVETVYAPESDDVLFVDTWVYGYDALGLTADLFDLAGAFRFRGQTKDDGILFRWSEGENWRELELRWVQGMVHARYRAHVPADHAGIAVFEGAWQPGPRTGQR